MLRMRDLKNLCCPQCHKEVAFDGREDEGRVLRSGVLNCDACQSRFRVDRGYAHLLHETRVAGIDVLMRTVYDTWSWMHDPGVRFGLPLWGGGRERELRDGYMKRLDLASLPTDGTKVRILEVGMGTGANIPLLLRDIPEGCAAEIWGMDISTGMLDICKKRIRKERWRSPDGSPIRLFVADAHHLPFYANAFDRVFHVGGIAAFRDPSQAMAEMARVAKAETPIVVVDEALDPDRKSNAYHRLMFRLLTAYDPDPHVPREHVPYGARFIADEQVTRFYYSLTFAMPAEKDVARSPRPPSRRRRKPSQMLKSA